MFDPGIPVNIIFFNRVSRVKSYPSQSMQKQIKPTQHPKYEGYDTLFCLKLAIMLVYGSITLEICFNHIIFDMDQRRSQSSKPWWFWPIDDIFHCGAQRKRILRDL